MVEKFVSFALFVVKKNNFVVKNILLNLCNSLNAGVH